MKRVIFVGVHNKPGKLPLCPSTRSGKVIKKVTSLLPNNVKVLRTNLYNRDYLPTNDELSPEGAMWEIWDHYAPTNEDVFVLLGARVRKDFIRDYGRIVEVVHPSYPKSRSAVDKYINDTANKIIETLND